MPSSKHEKELTMFSPDYSFNASVYLMLTDNFYQIGDGKNYKSIHCTSWADEIAPRFFLCKLNLSISFVFILKIFIFSTKAVQTK